ncbi:unnamed protein product [Albugo candida]|uniref:Adenosine kinase n=1 Tax=Albugo candida TaxID=65357 RepID=A0A024G8N2_9STRA|nr:unnamed protein product [Albugo candida]|eukprot:CCI43019.1 unnamed protein product [Albugo candida]
MDEDYGHLTHSIVGLGNPLLDIIAQVDEDFLSKHNLELDDAILAEDTHTHLFSELENHYKPIFIAGGSTLNTMRIVQWMLNYVNPKATCFFGSIGKDKNGQKLKECIENDGVRAHFLEHDDTSTGVCAVCLVENHRCLIAKLSAANMFHHEHLMSDSSKSIIENGTYFYVSSFHLTVSPESVLLLAQHAHEKNRVFMLGLAAPFIVEVYMNAMLTVIPFADFVFGNDTEARAFGAAHGWGNDLIDIALKLASLPKNSGLRARTIVLTQGSDPTIVIHQGEIFLFEVPQVDPSEIVETNGAGDAFVGGFISHFVLARSVGDCVKAGHWAAQVVIRSSGCTFPEKCEYMEKEDEFDINIIR